MPYIKIESPEYLVTAIDIITYLKDTYLMTCKEDIYNTFINNPYEIVKDFVDYIYNDKALPTKENIDELTQEIKDYLNNANS